MRFLERSIAKLKTDAASVGDVTTIVGILALPNIHGTMFATDPCGLLGSEKGSSRSGESNTRRARQRLVVHVSRRRPTDLYAQSPPAASDP